MSDLKPDESLSCFPVTDWTQVITVMQRGEEEAAWKALNIFCERYRSAIIRFFCRRGCPPEDAEDYTQDFFASRILRHWQARDGFLHTAKRRESSKFRSFLGEVLWCFLKDEWKKKSTQKRGKGTVHVPVEECEIVASGGTQEDYASFGQEFDRIFALEIIRKAAASSRHSKWLEAHFFNKLSQKEAAQQMGISEGAFKGAYGRFRQRLADALWDEVSKLVGPDEKEIRAEIHYLLSLFD